MVCNAEIRLLELDFTKNRVRFVQMLSVLVCGKPNSICSTHIHLCMVKYRIDEAHQIMRGNYS